MGSGKTPKPSRNSIAPRADSDRRDYDPLREAKNPTPPGRRKVKDRRKSK